MTTTKDKIHFTYGGTTSKSMGVINVQLNGGLFDETFVTGKSLNEVYSSRRRATLYAGHQLEVRSIELNLAFTKGFDDTKINNVLNWLYADDYYKPLIFEGYEDRIFYCMPIGESTIYHNGVGEGYITVEMQTNSPYVFGLEKNVNLPVGSSQNISYDGLDNPELVIKLTNGTGNTITLKKGIHVVTLTNLRANEVITIYPEHEDIETNLIGRHLYNNVTGDMSELNLTNGNNTYLITGATKAEFKFQPYYLR